MPRRGARRRMTPLAYARGSETASPMRVESRTQYLLPVAFSCWFLSEVCLSTPGHPSFNIGPIDTIAVAKGVSRVWGLVVFAHMILRKHAERRVTDILL